MNLRKQCLPPLWYPGDSEGISNFLSNFCHENGDALPDGTVIAAAAPHAGWYYSGAIAAQAVAALSAQSVKAGSVPDTIAVIGGHLPREMPALFAMEDAADTPLGPMEIDAAFRETFYNSVQNNNLRAASDRYQDNTVEVLLPMVKYFFPHAKLLWARFPADLRSFEAGKLLARAAASLGRKLLVIGSTDLTHYGRNYGFAPHGFGKEALDWVKNVNDRRFIDAVEAGDPDAVLARAEDERSACSAGAILGVMGYAAEIRDAQSGKAPQSGGPSRSDAPSRSDGTLLAYGTSADAADGNIPDSFVGYGAFIWNE